METDEILLHLATAMIAVQAMERSLVQVLAIAVPGKKVMTAVQAEEFVANLNKRTVGQLRDMLKDRADVHEKVLDVMESVVTNRNRLVHGLLKIAETPAASIEASLPISIKLSMDSDRLATLFNDLIMSRATELGITTPYDAAIKKLIGEDHLGNGRYLIRQKYPHKGEGE